MVLKADQGTPTAPVIFLGSFILHCTQPTPTPTPIIHHAAMLVDGDEIRSIAQQSTHVVHDIVHDTVQDQYTWRLPKQSLRWRQIGCVRVGALGTPFQGSCDLPAA